MDCQKTKNRQDIDLIKSLLSRPLLALLSILVILFSYTATAETIINDQAARQKLLGKHMLSLQWISWKRFGLVRITEKNGTLYVKGAQAGVPGEGANDYLTIEGRIVKINPRSFVFNGTIVTRVHHIAQGEPCVRKGTMTFRNTGKRRYWRLKEMDNPCSSVTDYVDIYF